jgi:hypothetical protein
VDSLTHVYFAEKLLTITGCDSAAAVCSLFPQIDRQPAYFHRMYGHPYFQIGRLAPLGSEVYRTGAVSSGMESDYASRRFLEERPRMLSYVEQFETETGKRISGYAPDLVSIVIGFASHTYQDIFNNPMQAFLPHGVYPCGKWELWAELDAIDFRTVLYEPSNIKAFRKELFSDPLWNVELQPEALVRAMVNRTAVSSIVTVPASQVEAAFESLALTDPEASPTREAEAWLIEHEHLLATMIRKYASAAVPASVPSGFQPEPVSS